MKRETRNSLRQTQRGRAHACVLTAQLLAATETRKWRGHRRGFGAKIAQDRQAVAQVVQKLKLRAIHALSEFTLVTS